MNTQEQLGLLLILVVVLGVGVARTVVIRRRNPQERERRRRVAVNLQGRLGDATILDASETVLYYSYTVGGVTYTAGQEIGDLRGFLPDDPERLIGHASLKYLTNNPANSILVCEEWSGLRSPVRTGL